MNLTAVFFRNDKGKRKTISAPEMNKAFNVQPGIHEINAKKEEKSSLCSRQEDCLEHKAIWIRGILELHSGKKMKIICNWPQQEFHYLILFKARISERQNKSPPQQRSWDHDGSNVVIFFLTSLAYFAQSFSTRAQMSFHPWRMAHITVMKGGMVRTQLKTMRQ